MAEVFLKWKEKQTIFPDYRKAQIKGCSIYRWNKLRTYLATNAKKWTGPKIDHYVIKNPQF